jgi:hypothetical protein
MKLRRHIDVEPIGESRWTKIGRSLFERLATEADTAGAYAPAVSERGPRRRWLTRTKFASAVAVAACAASVGWAVHRTAMPSMGALMSPSHIVTGSTGSLLVVGANTIAVAPESALVVSGDDEHGVLAVVERGRMTFSVAPRRTRPPFVVQAGDVGVRVVGTQFTVARTGDGAHVEVAHGVVEVTCAGVTANVRDGETWPAEIANRDPATETRTAEADRPAAAAAEIAPTAPLVTTAGATTAPVGPIGDARPRTAPPSTATAARWLYSPPHPSAEADDVVDAAVPSSAPDPTSPQSRFEGAERLERSEPDRALSLYREVAADYGPWAMNALFAAARLQAERGAAADARALLTAYISRYPQGPNAGDARRMLGGTP